MHKPIRTVAPASQPVTLAQAKAQCNVTHSSDDALITGLIAAATEMFDGWTGDLGIALEVQTWRQDFDAFTTTMRLPVPPVRGVTSITYQDQDDETQTVDSGDYTLRTDEGGPYVQFVPGWSAPTPTTSTASPVVSITYTAGYDTVPTPICQAILFLVSFWYDNRTPVSEKNMQDVPFTVHALTDRYRNALFA